MEHATGSAAIFSEWLLRPGHMAVVLVAAIGVALTLRLERDREDRHEPLALLALGLAAIGHSAVVAGAASAARRLFESAQFVPVTPLEPVLLLRFGQVLLVSAVSCGFVALALLHVKHIQRRGRVFAICAVGTSACTAWIVQYFLVAPPTNARDVGGIELARVERAYWPQAGWDQDAATASILADGRIEIEGVKFPTGAGVEALATALAPLARAMPQNGGTPDAALLLVVDRRAPLGALATLLAACGDSEVQLWKLRLLVERAMLDGRPAVQGHVPVWRPLPRAEASDQGHAEAEDVSLARLDVRASPEGELSYELEREPCADLSELTDRLREAQRGWAAIHAPPTLAWGALAPLLDALTAARTFPSDFAVSD